MNKHDVLSVVGVILFWAVLVGGIVTIVHYHSHSSAPPNNPAPANTQPTSVDSSQSTQTQAPATSSPAPTPSCSPVSDAASLEGTDGCIQFTGYAYTSSRGQMYLDQSLSPPYGFSAWIPAGYSFGPGVLSQYSGQLIDVTGSIVNYRGEPEIEVTDISQIQLAQ